MADITREELEAALDHQWVYAANREGTHHAQIVDPAQVAGELWEKLTAPSGDPAGESADNEIAALTIIVDRLEHLQTPTVQRVLRYLSDRYGTDG